MRMIYRLVDGIACDKQFLRDSRPVPDGFVVESDHTKTVDDLSVPAALKAKKDRVSAADSLSALREEAIQHFMRGEPMPADKIEKVKSLDEKIKKQ